MTTVNNWKARELEILRLMAQGLTNCEISARLHLAPETVRWYNKQLFSRLQVKNRQQAVNRAAELGLIGEPAPVSGPGAMSDIPRSPVQYVANRDVHIAYQVIGSGPVDLLFIHGFLSHLELAWQDPDFTRFFNELGRHARVILFDKRGVGLSDRIQGAPTLETTIQDACCVLEAVGSKRAFVMGTSEGGAAAVLLAATYPERVRGLVLYAAVPKVVRTNNEPAWADSPDDFQEMIHRLQKSWGGPWAIEHFAPSRAHDVQFRAWWAMILRAASSPSSIKAVLMLQRDVDIRSLLPQVRVKTLVIHKTDDHIASVDAGRYFATHMPNALWVELPGADHVYFIESEGLLSAVTQFCRQEQNRDEADTRIGILLYMVHALTPVDATSPGNLQSLLRSFAPKHIIRTAVGTCAIFDSPTRAIKSAQALRTDPKHSSLRMSLHVGACRVLDGEPLEPVLGLAEHAARSCAPGEIVLTQTLRDILAGSGFEFEERNGQSVGAVKDMPLYTVKQLNPDLRAQ